MDFSFALCLAETTLALIHCFCVCIVCCTTSGLAVCSSELNQQEHCQLRWRVVYTPIPLFLKVLTAPFHRVQSCISPHTKYILLYSSAACLHLTGSYFLLTWGETLPLKSAFLWWLHLKSHPAPSCPRFLFFFFSCPLLSLSLFHFFSLSPPSFSKSLGSLWCHSMRHYSSGAILYCCIVL